MSVIEIRATGDKPVYLDELDADLAGLRWHVVPSGYARRSLCGGKWEWLHQVVMARILCGPIPSGFTADHRDHCRVNNARSNLRLATRFEQAQNTRPHQDRPYKGVYRNSSNRRPFDAIISAYGKRFYLGKYLTIEEAAKAYDDAARMLHGAFACLNFPGGAA